MTECNHARDPQIYPRPADGWRAVGVLTVLYWFGTLDRQIVALLLPMIKADLQLSDSQVSLLPGLAFGGAFMLMSLPIGWLVDRVSRRAVLFVGVLCWSVAAISSGLSRTFSELFAARIVVGGSEASINPSAYSLLSDFFPPSRLTLPLSIFTMGGNLGSASSFMLGGLVLGLVGGAGGVDVPVLGHLNGWQAAFVLTGSPGLLLAFLIWIFPEARRHKTGTTTDAPNFADLGRQYRRHPSFYIFHALAIAMIMAFTVGLQSWNSTYLSRHFGWSLESIGFWLGFCQLTSSLLGLWFHGWAVDRMFSRGRHDAHFLYFGVMCVLACPLAVVAYLIPSAIGSIVCYSAAYFLLMGFSSIGPAALQITMPARLRGKASAVYMIVLSLVGTILGPIVIAGITDFVFVDETKLGYSMALFGGLTTLLGAVCCWWARAPMRKAVFAQVGEFHQPAN